MKEIAPINELSKIFGHDPKNMTYLKSNI
jgi:uncharacterized protein YeaO (DUF488 family)